MRRPLPASRLRRCFEGLHVQRFGQQVMHAIAGGGGGDVRGCQGQVAGPGGIASKVRAAQRTTAAIRRMAAARWFFKPICQGGNRDGHGYRGKV